MEATLQDQYIEFGIENEHYAIGIQEIHEIIKVQDITQIPNVRPHMKGVINLRGKIVPVISLRNLFALSEKAYSSSTRIVVVNSNEDIVGIIVDRVSKVSTFSEIQPPPDRVGGVDGNFFAGIGITNDYLVGILKLNEVLLVD